MFKKIISLLLVLTLVISISIPTLAQDSSESMTLDKLLPEKSGYQWVYQGFAEYGHTMMMTNVNSEEKIYSISGKVHDPSGEKSESESEFDMQYKIEGDAIVQYENGKMLDSNFNKIELIKLPLTVGNTWIQEMTAQNGQEVVLESKITNLEYENGNRVYTVEYNSTDGEYYEKRKIKQYVGVTYFQKPIDTDNGKVTFNYSINEEYSGYKSFEDFTDLDSNSWYAKYVNKLIKKDIIDGYPDNSFRPKNNIDVSEFTKLLLNSIGYEEPLSQDRWYNNYIAKAKELNIIDDNDFNDYDRPITRQEMSKMIVRAIGEDENTQAEVYFKDKNDIDSEYIGYIKVASSMKILVGYPDNTFRPNKHLTRAETSKVIMEVTENKDNTDNNTDKDNNKDELTKEQVISLEEDFINYLFQETNKEGKVLKYNSKEEIIDVMSNVIIEDEASNYVDSYFDVRNGELYQVAKDGPAIVIEDIPFYIEEKSEGEFLVTQNNKNELRGKYTLKIYYKKNSSGDYIITNRLIRGINEDGSIKRNVQYEVVDKPYPQDIETSLNKIKDTRGYSVIKETSDSYFIYIGLGEKSTGGYGIDVKYVTNMVDNNTRITIEKNLPSKDSSVTQAITYPHIVLKVDKVNDSFEVESLDGENFKKIN